MAGGFTFSLFYYRRLLYRRLLIIAKQKLTPLFFNHSSGRLCYSDNLPSFQYINYYFYVRNF
jgi:hypothetical protein